MKKVSWLMVFSLLVLIVPTTVSAYTTWIDDFTIVQDNTPSGGSSGGSGVTGDASFSDLSITRNGDVITVTGLVNAGSEPVNGIIELQGRDSSGGFLSFLSGPSTCDVNTPYNVHGTINVAAGKSQTFSLTSDFSVLAPQKIDLHLASFNQCCLDSNGDSQSCRAIQPFTGSTIIAEDVCLGSDCSNNVVVGIKENVFGNKYVLWILGILGALLVWWGFKRLK